jgi:hypothetical protein
MNTPTFRTIVGKREILFSAPHVYAHKRPTLSMAYKYGEPLTDVMVEELCNYTDGFGIVLINESDYDYNYHKEKKNPYKQEIRDIVKKEKIKYFLDIHGLKDGNMYDIAIYHPSKFTNSLKLARLLKESIGKGVLKGANIVIFRLPDNDQETLSHFTASQLRVPSVQIEVARYIRESKKLRDALVENISKVLEKEVV